MSRRGGLMLPSTFEGRVVFFGYLGLQVLVFSAAAVALARQPDAWERIGIYPMVSAMPLSIPLVHGAEVLGLLDPGRNHLPFLLGVVAADVLLLRWIVCWYECVLKGTATRETA
ncbi:MAG TPA: hypothetical protein VFX50_07010 [Gemmatimonadales bacterium]|nr:hypothetical protein [Gemmatimonadales bacterium]